MSLDQAHVSLLHDGFLRSVAETPSRTALEIGAMVLTYGELSARAHRIAGALPAGQIVAIVGGKSPTTYAGILGILLAGSAYLPLPTAMPLHRRRELLQRAGVTAVIVGEDSEAELPSLLGESSGLTVIAPNPSALAPLRAVLPDHVLAHPAELSAREAPPRVCDEQLAYLLFTSGSNGEPKGVGIPHRQVRYFLNRVRERYAFRPEDRFSQLFQLSFDLSVFDLFAAWDAGAAVVVASREDQLFPARYAHQRALTVWFSVPSVARLMSRTHQLQPAALPSLRIALFCGEPLTDNLCRQFASAAPGAAIDNLYGPTESTIACIWHRFSPEPTPEAVAGHLVPIGLPVEGMSVHIVDETLRPVSGGETGELCLQGPQLAPGYWRDEGATTRAFVVLPDTGKMAYRTGDRVCQPLEGGPLHFRGRVDRQIKIGGHRVELGEVEAVIRRVTGLTDVVAISPAGADPYARSIFVCVEGPELDGQTILQKCREQLPDYMVPRRLFFLPTFPRGLHGKVDHAALAALVTP